MRPMVMGTAVKTVICAWLAAMSACIAFPGASAAQTRDSGARQGEVRVERGGEITPEKMERWRNMPPEEKERVRERYKRWKELPPEKRERILERRRQWRELPEGERNFLLQRREIFRDARPEEKVVIRKFFGSWRELPPENRQALKRRIADWRGMPASERNAQMREWPFYRNLSPGDQKVIRRFLFSEPPAQPPGPRRNWRGEGPPGAPSRPPSE